MTDQEILEAVRASGINATQLATMLAKNVILLEVQEKRAALARAIATRDAFMQQFNERVAAQVAPYNDAVDAAKAEVATLEAQIAATL
jgi:hypothetical protein